MIGPRHQAFAAGALTDLLNSPARGWLSRLRALLAFQVSFVKTL